MSKKVVLFVFLSFVFLFPFNYFEFEVSKDIMNDSMIGFTINGSSATTFPSRDSGLSIGSIICDKGANGVWDYDNWTLKIRNVTESRTKCQVNFVSKYYESILNGTDPVLKDGLIPVTIRDDGTVTKASLGSEWYKYQEKKWANAVILNNETEVYYDGDIIPEEAIESYFVWIPRYRYKLFDSNNGNYTGLIDESNLTNKAQEILIEFENKNTTPSTGSSYGGWLTHPAFTSFNTNGMWVGKFETGYKGATTISEAEKNENNASKIQIKPDVYSWRGINVSNAYLSSYSYKRKLDSHMMKNTEWGCVAYLSHSKYGSKTSVRINNNQAYITGYAAKDEPTCGYTGDNRDCNRYESTTPGVDGIYTKNYFNPASVVASTTGNISGIYDMSGGVWEYVMGVMLDSTNAKPCTGSDVSANSGFNGSYCGTTGLLVSGVNFPESKYYDVYLYGTKDTEYNRRILGDATGEMGPFVIKKYGVQDRQIGSWYADESWFVIPFLPWFLRGGGFFDGIGTGAGVFTFGRYYGTSLGYGGFRVVLSF